MGSLSWWRLIPVVRDPLGIDPFVHAGLDRCGEQQGGDEGKQEPEVELAHLKARLSLKIAGNMLRTIMGHLPGMTRECVTGAVVGSSLPGPYNC